MPRTTSFTIYSVYEVFSNSSSAHGMNYMYASGARMTHNKQVKLNIIKE